MRSLRRQPQPAYRVNQAPDDLTAKDIEVFVARHVLAVSSLPQSVLARSQSGGLQPGSDSLTRRR